MSWNGQGGGMAANNGGGMGGGSGDMSNGNNQSHATEYTLQGEKSGLRRVVTTDADNAQV